MSLIEYLPVAMAVAGLGLRLYLTTSATSAPRPAAQQAVKPPSARLELLQFKSRFEVACLYWEKL
jgi:hypothetical protein